MISHLHVERVHLKVILRDRVFFRLSRRLAAKKVCLQKRRINLHDHIVLFRLKTCHDGKRLGSGIKGFPKIRDTSWGPHSMEEIIVGSILGSPYSVKL